VRTQIASVVVLLATALLPPACDALVGLSEPTVAGHDAGHDAVYDVTIDVATGDARADGVADAPAEQGPSCAPPAKPCAGSCVDVTTDSANCGACGHGCQGAPCSGGACGATVLATVGSSTPVGLALDGTNLYWTDGMFGQVQSYPLAGGSGTPSVIYSPTSFSQGGGSSVSGLAVSGGRVYFGENDTGWGSLYSCAVNGCGSTPVTLAAPPNPEVRAVVADDQNVYWNAGGQILSCPLPGCPAGQPTVLSGQVASNTLQSLALAGGRIYFTGGSIGSMPTPVGWCSTAGCNGAPQWLASTGELASSVAANSSGVFWGTEMSDEVIASPLPAPSAPPPSTTVVATLQSQAQFVADDQGAYFADRTAGGGTIYGCTDTSCKAPAIISTHVGAISAMTLDASRVYAAVTTQTGMQILWVAR
jgi:hypothetical protein